MGTDTQGAAASAHEEAQHLVGLGHAASSSFVEEVLS